MQAVVVGDVGAVVPVVYEVDGLVVVGVVGSQVGWLVEDLVVYEVDGLVVVGVVGSQVGWLVEDLVVYVVDDLVVVSHCDDVGGLAVVVEPD